MEKNEMPENFPVVLQDFLKDLTLTFPEYKYLWEQWQTTEMIEPIYRYCLGVYPERFFDILYQNEEIFEKDSEINTQFLPNVDFRIFFSVEGISDTTKQAIWKYLQLILITIMSGVKDKTGFGETMNLFDGIDEIELESKLSDTIHELNDFFKKMASGTGEETDETNKTGETSDEGNPNPFDFGKDFAFDLSGVLPDAANLHEHLKGLFDGKIGKLAKELAEEFSHEFSGMFGEGDIQNTQDVFKKVMKNPKKLMELMKTIGSKLEERMKKGDISKEEIMKEASELMGKMKGMGNGKEFQNMMKNMTKNMGGLGAAAAAMGGGKTKFNMGAMQQMANQYDQKEKMRAKLEQRKAEGKTLSKTAALLQQCNSSSSTAQAPISDDWLDDYESPVKSGNKQQPGSGKSKKKGKK